MRNAKQIDEECQVEAARAVEQGTTLIQNHLSNHLDQNPDSSFVTWIATLHPENASITIDTRFLVPDNPWWTVYEECKHDLPTATAVAVDDKYDSGVSTITNPPASTQSGSPHACVLCSPIVLIIGGFLSLSAVLTVTIMELVATCFYLVSAVFFHMSKCLSPPNVFTGLLYSLFTMLYWTFALVDSILLVTSVFVTELLAGAAFLLAFIFGGVLTARNWHQYIRRTCHLARWASRSGFSNPPRHLV